MSAQAQVGSRPRVLFVDDEPRVLNSMRIMFRREYDTFFAENGQAALNIIKAHEIDVIVCDHRMPEMTGVEVLAKAKVLSPRSVRILLTGYADLNAVEESINEGEVFRFLTKPCAPNELRDAIKLATSVGGDTGGRIRMSTRPDVSGAAARGRDAQHSRGNDLAAPFDAASTVVLERRPGQGLPSRSESMRKAAPSRAVVVLTGDDSTHQAVVDATRGKLPVYRASSIRGVVDILLEQRPGVLLTDISEDRATIQQLTAKLKMYVPELVTITVSEHRDVLDMVWLINHGQIFRFLRKPLSPGRCALSLKAALEHHRKLVMHPSLALRHAVERSATVGEEPSWLTPLRTLRRLWSWK